MHLGQDFAPAPTSGGGSWWQDLISGFIDPYYRPTETPNWTSGGGGPYVPPGGVPTYGTTTYAPYCQNVWIWAIGGALVAMLLLGKNGK